VRKLKQQKSPAQGRVFLFVEVPSNDLLGRSPLRLRYASPAQRCCCDERTRRLSRALRARLYVPKVGELSEAEATKKPGARPGFSVAWVPDNDLLSHGQSVLSSAYRRFTVLFGMGRSGTSGLWSSGVDGVRGQVTGNRQQQQRCLPWRRIEAPLSFLRPAEVRPLTRKVRNRGELYGAWVSRFSRFSLLPVTCSLTSEHPQLWSQAARAISTG
jgi:hypothetical protein